MSSCSFDSFPLWKAIFKLKHLDCSYTANKANHQWHLFVYLHLKIKLFQIAQHIMCRSNVNMVFELTNTFVEWGRKKTEPKSHWGTVNEYLPVFHSSLYWRLPKANFKQDRDKVALSLTAVLNCLLHTSYQTHVFMRQ